MARDVSDVTHRKRGLRFEKSQLVEFCRWKKKFDFRLYAEALWRVRTWFGADGKVSIERWYLSPYVEKPLYSKVKKSFVPELRSRKCSSCFGIPMLSIYELWTFYVHFTYSCMALQQGVLQGDTLAPYLLIICLDYVVRTSIDKIKENGFELIKKKQKVPRKTNYRRRLRRWHSDSGKYTQSSRNTTA